MTTGARDAKCLEPVYVCGTRTTSTTTNGHYHSPQIFYADAVLFDMDGALTDSISAVEAAWGKVAQDIGKDSDMSSQLPTASVPSTTCLISSRTSRSTKWIAKSPNLKNLFSSSPTHTGFMALVLNSGISLVECQDGDNHQHRHQDDNNEWGSRRPGTRTSTMTAIITQCQRRRTGT